MKTTRSVAALAAALGSLAALGCQTAPPPPSTATTTAAAPTPMPSPSSPAVAHAEHIKLQHILIAFAGKVPGKNITRSQDEARALANQVFERAKKGEDFDSLVRTYTDDRAPGLYSLSNSGVAPAPGEFSRDRMVPAFGNVGFSLAPGEIGMAEYDPRTSPYGWHIIKRLE
jgi:hypothetical protein